MNKNKEEILMGHKDDVEMESIPQKCRHCGDEYEEGVIGGLCSHKCRIANIENYRREILKIQKELYTKYFK